MKFVTVTNEEGSVLHIPDYQFNFLMRLPMETSITCLIDGMATKINGLTNPFDQLKEQLLASDTRFVVLPLPEGTDAVVNPLKIQFLIQPDETVVNKSVIVFPGPMQMVIAEGLHTLKAKLNGESPIIVGE